MLEVRLLGELEVDACGRAVAQPAARRAWELLAWLALHPGEHPRSAVAARFWPDVLDASARASLRSAAWALRRALGPAGEDALVAGRDRIGLRCATDLARFEAHVAAGEHEAAVALCRGPLLADLDADWVLEARDAHDERVGAALARLTATAATPAEAITWARRRLALDPLDEEAARDLMRRLAEAGDRAGALQVAARLGDRLRTTLGLAPSAATRELTVAIREGGGDVSAAGGGVSAAGGGGLDAHTPPGTARAPAPVAPAAPGVPPLVGRDAPLATLTALWDAAREGQGAVAVLGGEGGIGKTRLAADLLSRARADGARTATCAAVDISGATPFGLWAELLAELARVIEPPAAGAAWPEELGRLAPALPRRLGRASPATPEVAPEMARARLFEAAVELVEHASADRPLALLFDDVHLADAASLELCAHVARRVAGLPVMLVLTRRGVPRCDEVDALLLAAGGRGARTAELVLDPLTRTEAEELVRAVGPLDTLRREQVVAAADGNPLLAIESARAAVRGDDPLAPPPSLRAAVRAAIAPLPAPARRVAELAAVAGRDLDRTELARLAHPSAVLAALDCGLLDSVDGRFGYRHALLREAVVAALGDAELRELHEALGTMLDHRPAEAARHLRIAGRGDLAARKLLVAAAAAHRTTAFEQAAAYQREATELTPGEPEPWLALAETLAVLGRRDDAEAALREALGRLDPDLPHARATAHLGAARWYRSSLCDPGRAGAAAQRGLDALGAGGELPDLRFELLAIRGWSEITASGADAADATLAELEGLGVDLAADAMRRHDVTTLRGFAMLARGRLDEAEALMVASGEAAENATRPDMAYGGWANAACIAVCNGGFERALGYADRALALAQGLPTLVIQLLSMRAFLLWRLGREDEAFDAAATELQVAERLGVAELCAVATHDNGLLALATGDHERAAELLGRALAGDPPIVRAESRLRRAEALARCGRIDEAEAEIRLATQEPVRPAHRPAVLVARMAFAQALCARGRGDVTLAERRLDEAAGHWRRLAGEAVQGRDHLATLVDLGRPPVTGVLDPERELAAIAAERADLQSLTL